MDGQRQYWVISPKVDDAERNVDSWKKEILRRHAAFMGWPPDEWGHGAMGPKFCGNPSAKSRVEVGDVILIARRHNREPDLVGFGIVKGKCKKTHFPWSKNEYDYSRDLEQFTPCEAEAKGIDFLNILGYPGALHQIHPYEKGADVCQWIEQQLKLEDQNGQRATVIEKGTRKSKTRRYKVTKPERVIEIRRREAALQDDYEQWLLSRGRHLSTLRYGRMECDAWEDERRNLIEAKGSVSREDIRMAVGELFHYAFLGHEKCTRPNLAVLLPKYPSDDYVKWLESIDIKVIWRKGKAFVDNANGQFT